MEKNVGKGSRMKKIFIVVIIIFFISYCVFANETIQTVSFRAVVPSDYGVTFPQDALRLDRLFFQLPNGDLVSYKTNLDEFIVAVGENSMTLDILYYGNIAEDYTVIIDAASYGMMIGSDGENRVPVSLSFEEYWGSDGIESSVNIDGSVSIIVPATGTRLAEKVGSLILEWEYPLELVPGNYTMELDLTLRNEV